MRTPGFVRLAAFAALTLLVLVASCTDGGAPVGPQAGDGAVALVLERSLFPMAAEASLPINRIRAVARLVPSGEVVGEALLDVDPTEESWEVELDLDLGAIVAATVQVTFELINVGPGGVESVQFSGRTEPISVIPGRDVVADVTEVVQGGLGNLGVTAVQIPEPLASLAEGASRALTATVTTSQPALPPTVFWSSLDATATVTGNTVTAVLPGTARIVAAAGSKADTAVLTILARPTAVRVTPDSSDVGLGQTINLSGVVLDPRSAPISGQALLWRSLTPTILEDLGGGSFRSVGVGRGLAEARAAADTLLKATALVRVARPVTDVAVTKTASAATADEGGLVTFTVTVANLSGVAASGVRVSEELPAGFTLASTAPSAGTFAAGTWSVGTLAAGASATLQVGATVNAGTAGSTLTNVARLLPLDGQVDGNAGNDQAAAAVAIAQRDADLALTKEVADATLLEGDTARFTITVTNRGPATAGGVIVSDDLPAGLTYLTHAESHGSFSAAGGAWSVGDLPSGASATLVMQALVADGTSGQTLTNRARITGLSGAVDIAPANDSSSASVTVGSATILDVALSKSVDDATPAPGQTVIFTVVVHNSGPIAATGITVSDTLPGGFIGAQWVTTSGVYESGLWDIPAIAAGEADTLRITAQVAPLSSGQTLTNVARLVAIDQDDVLPSNDMAQVSVTVGSPVQGPLDHAYRTVGNTALLTGAYEAAYIHLSHPDNALAGTTGLTVTSTGGLETFLGGTVLMEQDGDFAYLPPPGVVSAVDSVRFETIDGNQNQGSARLEFTIETTIVWYVDNAADPGSGRSHEPFSSIADALGAAGENPVTIYLAAGVGAYGETVLLQTGQSLIGSGVDLVVSEQLLAPAGTRPTIEVAAGSVIYGYGGNTVAGLNVNEIGGGGSAISASEAVDFTLQDVTVEATGDALDFSYLGGAWTLERVSVMGAGDAGLSLSGFTGSWTVNDLHIENTGGVALHIEDAGTDLVVNLAPGSIRNGDGDGPPLAIRLTQPGASVTIAGDSIVSDGAGGILIENNQGDVTVEATIRVTDPTQDGVVVIGNTGLITLTDANVDATSGAVNGALLASSNVDATFGSLVAHNTVGGIPVMLNGLTGSVYIGDLDARAQGGEAAALFAQTVENLVVQGGGAIGTAGAAALLVSGVNADVFLDSIHASGGGSTLPGVTITGTSGDVAIDAGSISGRDSNAFLVSQGNTASIFYLGGIQHENFDNSVIVEGSTGGTVWFAGPIVDVGGGIFVTGNTNGTEIYFTGALDVTTNESNIPFHVVDNPGAQVRIQSNGMSVFRGANVPSAVRIVNTDIDGNGIEIDSVFASSVIAGIEIEGVGVGSFEVMGGQIQGDQGVSITDFTGARIDLNNLDVSAWGDAIHGLRVKDLTISGSTIADAGSEVGGQGIDLTSPSGTLTIAGTTVTGSANENVLIQSNSGEQVAIAVANSFIEAAGNNGLDVTALGTAAVSIDVSATEFDTNGTSALRAALHRNGMMVRAFGTSTVDLTVRDNTLFDANLEHGLVLLDSANAVFNVNVGGGTFRQNGATTSSGYGLLLLADHGTTSIAGFRGDLSGNTFEDNYSGGIQGDLIGDARSVLRVLNNTVSQQAVEEGMMFRVGEPTNGSSSEATLDVLFNGNVVSVADGRTSAADGILLRTEGFANLCLAGAAASNTVTVDVLDAGVEAFATPGSTFRVENLNAYQGMSFWLDAVFQITTGDAFQGKATGTFTPIATGTCARP